MSETGFRYFIEFMQARNAPPKPITRPAPPASTLLQAAPTDEDYTDCVCVLHKLTPKTPAYEEVLLDIEDFDRLKDMSWRIDRWGRNKEKYAVSKNAVQIGAFIVNPPKGKIVDHIRSSRTLDNRRCNLRVTTQGEHQVNTRRHKDGTSQYKGVQRHQSTGKWFVQCGPRDHRIYVGGFDTEVEAARAYNGIAQNLYGPMACLNPV